MFQSVSLPVPHDSCLYPQTLEEIAEMEEEIRRLEEELRRKMQDLKVVHTRLETRTYRPRADLCQDQVLPGGTGGTGWAWGLI